MKDLEQRKAEHNAALELYNKLLNMYKPQYDKLTKAQKKKIKVQNVSEMSTNACTRRSKIKARRSCC